MPSFPLVELVLSATVPSWMPLGTFGLTEAVELGSVEFVPRRKSKEGNSFSIFGHLHILSCPWSCQTVKEEVTAGS